MSDGTCVPNKAAAGDGGPQPLSSAPAAPEPRRSAREGFPMTKDEMTGFILSEERYPIPSEIG
jgi:hypothetical protein